jgi:shikimate kinase
VDKFRPVLVLIGAPGAGKSRIGKRVARLLDVDFVDTDRRIVQEHGEIASMFDKRGEAHFRKLEREAVEKALREPAVVALGGGAVLDPETQDDLAGLTVALLTTRPDAVQHRILGDKRPLIKGDLEAWKRLVEERQPIYERLATRSFDTSDETAERLAAEIAEWIRAGAHD